MNQTEIDNSVRAYLDAHHMTGVDVRAALCDMDGTLYDSMPRHARAWHRLITEQGIECTEDEFFLYEGMTGADTLRLLFGRAFGEVPSEERIKELYHLKTVYFNEQPGVQVMPGARRLIDTLVGAGVRPVLVTGSGQRTLIDRLNDDFGGVFSPELMVTSHNVTHGKPHPEPYLKAMEMAGETPATSIAFENAPRGVESAARAGVFTVAVATGPVPHEALRRAGASIVFSSMPECADFISQLLYTLKG